MDAPIVARLTINLLANGRVQIDGIPENQLICYGMLELTKELCSKYYAEQANRMVQPATVIPMVKPS